MNERLLTREGDPVIGEFVERDNRFVIRVDFGDEVGRAFLGDPGALRDVLVPGYEVLCEPVDDPERATDYDAIAIRVSEATTADASEPVHVSLRAALANDLFASALDGGQLPQFDWADEISREPALPDHGRTDFHLATDGDGSREAFVEVKSATHVEDGVVKFPDRQTERGRRHLRSLESALADDTEAHLAFVVQRPDVERLRPFREVDPEFADLLARVSEAGVEVHALVTAFDPPHYSLRRTDLPVELDA
ncbi:sugar fermentation stimulation protein A [Halomicrobium zhouii]|uniref:Sugar fermentation stimulation protein A n=1 Tax=Halomicrobium zhouii TaxID=767519 RepID=A0A1I6KQS4_9EURY|nr:DNA/RNA nuclease SfsA [Halomicrobium zhouii]SFR93583.1 sugar fermentation stimulation protein A [Halomicrobium zhouii]